MPKLTQKQLIDAARRAAKQVNGPLSRNEFVRITGINRYNINRLFPEGRWNELKRLAGLQLCPNTRMSDDSLLEEYHRVASKMGKIPSWVAFEDHAACSASVIRNRFGNMRGTLKHYGAWLEKHHSDSPLLTHVRELITRGINRSLLAGRGGKAPAGKKFEKPGGPDFGPPIAARSLRYAPVNEMGVVFLFGMLCERLGFIVEAVHGPYPDCIAKRCVDPKRNRYRQVLIEFEYQSGHFRTQGHDPACCDLIVCWEHDWPDCPIEVLELQRFINELE